MGLPDRQELRVGDVERHGVVDQLRVHFGDGRLTLDEFEERTGAALAARTVAELQVVTADLPVVRSGPKGPPIRVKQPAAMTTWDKAIRIHTGFWLVLSASLVLLWALVGGGFFWPGIVFVAVGFTVAVHAVVKKAVGG